jgi:hypothetical protein
VVRGLLLLMLMLASSSTWAQDFVGARAMSLGESYRAIATGNDALYFNPAGLPVLKRYAIEGQYLLSLNDERHMGDVSVVDSMTNPLAVGLAYTFLGAELSQRRTIGHTATLGMAYPIFDRLFSVGVGLKYKSVTDAIAGNYLNAVTADVGALSIIPGGISLAAVGYNLVPLRNAESSHVPISAGFAAALDLGPLSTLLFGGTPSFGPVQTAAGVPLSSAFSTVRGPLDGLTVSFDWLLNFETIQGTKSRVSTGLEWLIADIVPIRAGYLYNEATDNHRVSVGMGVIVPYFGLDVAYQQGLPVGEQQFRDEKLDERLITFALKGFLPM